MRRKRHRAISWLNQLNQAIFNEMFQSEIGKQDCIPLANLIESFRYGTSNKSSETGYPTLRIPNIIGSAIDSADLKMVPLAVAEFARLKLIDGDVLFVRTNGNRDYVGRSAVFTLAQANASGFESQDWAYASYLIRARLRKDQLNPWFLQAYLTHPLGRRALKERSKTSAGQFNINTEGLGSIPIPNVSIQKQQLFADKHEKLQLNISPFLISAKHADDLFASLQRRAFQGEL